MAASYISLHTDFPRTVKALRTAKRAGISVYRLQSILIAIWMQCSQTSDCGELAADFDQEFLEILTEGDAPANLLEILIAAGWIDRGSDGRLSIHNWCERQPYYARLARDRERKRGKTSGNPADSEGTPGPTAEFHGTPRNSAGSNGNSPELPGTPPEERGNSPSIPASDSAPSGTPAELPGNSTEIQGNDATEASQPEAWNSGGIPPELDPFDVEYEEPRRNSADIEANEGNSGGTPPELPSTPPKRKEKEEREREQEGLGIAEALRTSVRAKVKEALSLSENEDKRVEWLVTRLLGEVACETTAGGRSFPELKAYCAHPPTHTKLTPEIVWTGIYSHLGALVTCFKDLKDTARGERWEILLDRLSKARSASTKSQFVVPDLLTALAQYAEIEKDQRRKRDIQRKNREAKAAKAQAGKAE